MQYFDDVSPAVDRLVHDDRLLRLAGLTGDGHVFGSMEDNRIEALLKPFEISLFADPAGSFTTAAAMIAVVEKTLKRKKARGLRDAVVAIFGATGVVGITAGVIAAFEGAKVTFVGYDGISRVLRNSAEIKRRFGVDVAAADGSTPELKAALLAGTEVVLCAARAGARVVDAAQIAAAHKLLVVCDVNAVPPSGVEGLELHADATPLGPNGALGIGALAVGDVKYRTESGLFKRMTESPKALRIDFRHAFELAREIA